MLVTRSQNYLRSEMNLWPTRYREVVLTSANPVFKQKPDRKGGLD
jgi:hypothetical protein